MFLILSFSKGTLQKGQKGTTQERRDGRTSEFAKFRLRGEGGGGRIWDSLGFVGLNPKPQITYPFKDLHKEIIIGNPERVGSLGSR